MVVQGPGLSRVQAWKAATSWVWSISPTWRASRPKRRWRSGRRPWGVPPGSGAGPGRPAIRPGSAERAGDHGGSLALSHTRSVRSSARSGRRPLDRSSPPTLALGARRPRGGYRESFAQFRPSRQVATAPTFVMSDMHLQDEHEAGRRARGKGGGRPQPSPAAGPSRGRIPRTGSGFPAKFTVRPDDSRPADARSSRISRGDSSSAVSWATISVAR